MLFVVQIQAAKDPERHYRLEDVNLSMPKWGNACGWEAEDDQKLLLGCYWCASPQCLSGEHIGVDRFDYIWVTFHLCFASKAEVVSLTGAAGTALGTGTRWPATPV